MLKSLIKKLFGDKQSRDVKRLTPLVNETLATAKEYEALSDEDLQSKTNEFRRLLRVVPRMSRVGDVPIVHEMAEVRLARHPDVAEAVFLGMRRDFRPCDLVAFVRLKEGKAPSADLAEQVRGGMTRLLPAAAPKHVVFLDEFPRKKHVVEGTSTERLVADRHQLTRLIEERTLAEWESFIWDDVSSKLSEESGDPVSLDDLLPEAFAAMKETCRRHVGKKWMAAGGEITWNMVPFDVQIMGGIALHQGNIGEMGTGEGKTLVAIFPLYLNSLTGRGAHLVTVNDYLAKRDSEWMGPIFEFMGISVGCLDKTQPGSFDRRAMYLCDVTYGTNNEFGFDYLRDNMVMDRYQLVQRDHAYGIIDEVDSVLIDEARTPLIIAGPVDRSNKQYEELIPKVRELVGKQTMLVNGFAKEASDLLEKDPTDWEAGLKLLLCYKGMPKHNKYMKLREEPRFQKLQDKVEAELMLQKRIVQLEEELYFVVDERNRQLHLTEKGRVELSPENPEYWVLTDLVDEFSKIEMMGKMSDEEKERKKLEIRATYDERAEALHTIQQLVHAYVLKRRDVDYVVEDGKVVIVDENTGRKMTGRRWSDGLHGAVEAKENVKIEKETQTLATITIQNYFRLYAKLSGMTGTAETEAAEFMHTYKMDVIVIPPNVSTKRVDLNDVVYRTKREKYAAVIDEIERLHKLKLPILVGTTSVANSETVSRMLKSRKLTHNVLNAKNHAKEAEIVAEAGLESAITIATNMAGRGTDIKLGPGVCDDRKDEDGDMIPGGLQIIGTERHESRRIDRQLRGRAGRQGDPGTSRFFVSLEDDLMLWFGSDRISTWMGRLGMQEGEPITHPLVTRAIGNAQKKIEGINHERRKRTLEYDDVMNKQRETIYKLRREILLEDNLREVLLDVFADAIEGEFRNTYGDVDDPNQWETEGFFTWIGSVLLTSEVEEARTARYFEFEKLLNAAMAFVVDAYDAKHAALGDEMTNRLGRFIALQTITSEWQDHLLAIDSLREDIGLRSYGQREPLVEFTKDATKLFSDMLLSVHKDIFEKFFRTQIVTPEEEARRRAEAQKLAQAKYSKPQEAPAPVPGHAPEEEPADGQKGKPHSGLEPYRRDMPKVGRNDLCPCGSGKKFKECHGVPALREGRQHTVGAGGEKEEG
jgi:preprotein translocase subunit SecA